jgi:hypothetical protein
LPAFLADALKLKMVINDQKAVFSAEVIDELF